MSALPEGSPWRWISYPAGRGDRGCWFWCPLVWTVRYKALVPTFVNHAEEEGKDRNSYKSPAMKDWFTGQELSENTTNSPDIDCLEEFSREIAKLGFIRPLCSDAPPRGALELCTRKLLPQDRGLPEASTENWRAWRRRHYVVDVPGYTKRHLAKPMSAIFTLPLSRPSPMTRMFAGFKSLISTIVNPIF